MRIKLSGLSLFAAVALAGVAGAETTRVLNFEADTIGSAPAGMSFATTKVAGKGEPGGWVVAEEGGERGRVLVQTTADRTSGRFPVAVVDATIAADVDVSVRFKPVSGNVDMAAGLVWRYRDADNYYIVRANALEDNVVLYKVEKGRRIDLPLKGLGKTYGAKAPVPKGQWSTLRVVATGPLFAVELNGQKLYEVEDTTFSEAGKVGVWTKADSVTRFDELAIRTK
jgi:hypothetical protein